MPRSVLQTAMVCQLLVNPMPIRIDPKLTPRKASQFAGPALGRIRFCGLRSLAIFRDTAISEAGHTYAGDLKYALRSSQQSSLLTRGGDKDKHVGDEEYHHDDGVPASLVKAQILLHARDERQAEIRAVDQGDGVHQPQDGEKSPIDAMAMSDSLLEHTIA